MLSGCHPNKISVTMNRYRPLLFVLDFLTGLTFGQTADRSSDPAPAEYTFRFVAGDGMFYTPCNGNGEELGRLLACIAQHKVAMYDGKLPVRADGYCTSQPSEAENLAMAKTCQNRVKTEMALRDGVAEALWKSLMTVHRWSNIYNAHSIPTKLRSFGAEEPADLWNDSVLIERMARVEHNRWVMERLIQGYRPATVEEEQMVEFEPDKEKRKKKKKALEQDIFAHICLKPYDALSKSFKDYDRMIMKYLWRINKPLAE